MSGYKAIFLVASFIVLIIYGVSDWRRALKFVFFYIPFEGALRKWIFPDYHQYIYFLKEIVLAGAYLRFFLSNVHQISHHKVYRFTYLLLGLFSLWCLLEIANPNFASLKVTFFGIRNYIFYIPIMFMVPFLFESKEKLLRFLTRFAYFAVPLGVLGIIQFFSPPSSAINKYVWTEDEMNIALFGTQRYVRITSTFSYITGYTTFLSVAGALLLALIHIKRSKLSLFILCSIFALVSGNLMMTGSRGPLFLLALAIPIFLFLAGIINPFYILKILPRFLMLTLAVFLAMFIWFRPAVTSFWERVVMVRDIQERIQNSVFDPIRALGDTPLLGYGLGSTHQAIRFLSSRPNLNLPPEAEDEPIRILYEMGPFGFLFFYVLKVIILTNLGALVLKAVDRDLKIIALGVFLSHMITFPITLIFNQILLFYFWFLAGMLLLLPKLELLMGLRFVRRKM